MNQSELYSQNFLAALEHMRRDLKGWVNLHVSWFSKAALIKMITLPGFLHLMQLILICQTSTLFVNFKPLPKKRGGLLDLQHYHWACLLASLVDWHIHDKVKVLVLLV